MRNNSYKRAMEKIVVSDELKNKILYNAKGMQNKSVRSKIFYFKFAVGVLTCIAVFIVSSLFVKDYIFVDKTLPSSKVSVETEKNSGIETEEEKETETFSDLREEYAESKNETEVKTKEKVDISLKKSEPDKIENNVSGSDSDTENFGEEIFFDETSDSDKDEIGSLKDAQEKVEYDVKAPAFMPKGYEIDNITLTQDDNIKVTYQNDFDLVTYTIGDCESDDDIFNRYSVVRTEDVNGVTVTLKGNGNIYNDIEWNDGKVYSLYSENGFLIYTAKRIVESVDSVLKI